MEIMAWSRGWWLLGTGLLALKLHILLTIIQAVRKRRRTWRELQAFQGPKPHWLLGNSLSRDPSTFLKTAVGWCESYGDAHLMWISFSGATIRMCGPDTIRTVLAQADPKDGFVHEIFSPWIGDGLLMSNGKKWARNRRLLTPAFHFDVLKPYVTTFSDSANIMLNKWQDQAASSGGSANMEMFQSISLMTLDSLMKCIFGVHDQDIQTQGNNHPYIQSVYDIAKLTTMRFNFPPLHNPTIFYLSPTGFRYRKAVAIAHKFTRDVIDSKPNDREQVDVKGSRKYLSFLDILLDCKDSDGEGLSYQEICDETDTFMFEGHDTTASGISWFLYNLARHPDIQQKCRDEVNTVLADNENVEWDDLSKFEYLTMCLKESLRLHAPVPGIGRVTSKPLQLPDGRHIPQGTMVSASIYVCHHNKRIWKDPEVYDPERFTPENSKNRHPHAFVPFSAGPRNCIGQHFAYNEMKTCVAQILRRFVLSVDESRPSPVMIPELILRARDGLWLKCTPIATA